MRRIPVRFLFLFLIAVCNFLPLHSASAQQQQQQMWHVWRKLSCSMTRNEWLTVAQEKPSWDWELCEGSTAHFTRASAQKQMNFLRLIQCNADMPNCPRFQNDCCDVEIYQNNRTGAITIMGANETPPPLVDGWQYSPLNSPTQCCEEAELAAGILGPFHCREIDLGGGVIVIFNGPGKFLNKATGQPLPPGQLPFQPRVTPPDSDPPIVVDLDPEIELDDEEDDPEKDNQPDFPREPEKENPQPPTQPQPPAEKPPAPSTNINPDWPGVYVRGACTFNVAPSGEGVSVNFQCTDGGNGTLFNCNTHGSRASADCDYTSTDSAHASHKGMVFMEYTGDPQGRPEYQCLKLHFTEEEPNKGARWDVWCANRKT